MKTLYLVRHAKSSWKYNNLDDFERPLNKRGHHDAPVMGKQFKKLGILPQLILCSPANRAATTARLIAEQLSYDEEQIHYHAAIYEASVTTLREIVSTLPAEYDEVMLIGHNPAMTELANVLGDRQIGNLPTCGVYAIQSDARTWRQLSTRKNRCLFIDKPKDHMNTDF